MLNDKNHFLHKLVKLEFYKEGSFFELLDSFGYPLVKTGDLENEYSVIDWNLIPEKFSFFYDYEGSENEISEMLKNSELIKKPYLLTYFNSDKELVKVKTLEFIDNWNSFNYAVAWQGMTFVSNDGKLILEFTVDSKYDLISNFKIDKQ